MGEVDETQYAVDHRVAQGDEPVHRTLRKARHEQALELVSGEAHGIGVAPSGERVVRGELLCQERKDPDDDQPDQEDPDEREEPVDP